MSTYPLAVSELALIGVADAGVPNKERVILRPTQLVDVRHFAIVAGLHNPATGGANVLYDTGFWFPEHTLTPPSWILVYTGEGESQNTVAPNGERVITYFWGRKHTLFGFNGIVPVLVRIDAAIVGRKL